MVGCGYWFLTCVHFVRLLYQRRLLNTNNQLIFFQFRLNPLLTFWRLIINILMICIIAHVLIICFLRQQVVLLHEGLKMLQISSVWKGSKITSSRSNVYVRSKAITIGIAVIPSMGIIALVKYNDGGSFVHSCVVKEVFW